MQAKVNDLNTQLMNISSRITALENQLAQKNQELTEKKDQIEDTKDQLEDAKSRKSSVCGHESAHTVYVMRMHRSLTLRHFLIRKVFRIF